MLTKLIFCLIADSENDVHPEEVEDDQEMDVDNAGNNEEAQDLLVDQDHDQVKRLFLKRSDKCCSKVHLDHL